jgi:hypothetical protein
VEVLRPEDRLPRPAAPVAIAAATPTAVLDVNRPGILDQVTVVWQSSGGLEFPEEIDEPLEPVAPRVGDFPCYRIRPPRRSPNDRTIDLFWLDDGQHFGRVSSVSRGDDRTAIAIFSVDGQAAIRRIDLPGVPRDVALTAEGLAVLSRVEELSSGAGPVHELWLLDPLQLVVRDRYRIDQRQRRIFSHEVMVGGREQSVVYLLSSNTRSYFTGQPPGSDEILVIDLLSGAYGAVGSKGDVVWSAAEGAEASQPVTGLGMLVIAKKDSRLVEIPAGLGDRRLITTGGFRIRRVTASHGLALLATELLAVSRDGSLLGYATSRGRPGRPPTVRVFEVADLRSPLGSFSALERISCLGFVGSDGELVVAGSFGRPGLHRFDPAGKQITVHPVSGGMPERILASPGGSWLLIAWTKDYWTLSGYGRY